MKICLCRVWRRWGFVGIRCHVLPHPITVSFHCTATLPRTHLPPLPGVLLYPFFFEAPCVRAQTAGAVLGCPPACASCLGPVPFTFAEFTRSQPNPPPVCLRAPSCLLAHRAFFVQLLSPKTWIFRSQDPSPSPPSDHHHNTQLWGR